MLKKSFSLSKWLMVLLVAILAVAVASCTSAASPSATTTVPTTTTAPTTATTSAPPVTSAVPTTSAAPSATVTAAPTGSAVVPPSASPSASASAAAIGSVEVLAVWGSTEQDSFMAMVAPWQQQTGGKVNFTGTRDLNAVLQTRVQAGNPPDIAILPNPGAVKNFAGNLKPLGPMLNMSTINQQYSADWLATGTVNGNLYAIPIKAANKALIWYNPKTFSANSWQIPNTWDDLISLSNMIVAAKKTPANPWAVGLEAGQASGFPATDWIAQIFLSKYGGSAYDQWVNHQIPWTDARIKDAWSLFGTIVNTPNYVAGGAPAALAGNFQNASYLPFQNPPRAAMYYEGDFVEGFITAQFPKLVAGQDFNFFPFPAVNPSALTSPGASASASPSASASASATLTATAVTTGADLIVAFKDNPAIRSFISYMATPQAQTIWVKRGGFTSVNKQVSVSDYPDSIAGQAAQILVSAPLTRFGAGDSMPPAVQTAWWAATLQYLQNPGQLDSILANLENTAKTAYGASPSPSASASASPAASVSPSASASASPSAYASPSTSP